MTQLARLADADAAAAHAANVVGDLIAASLEEHGRAHIALAGGTTWRRAYELLAPRSWEGVELWFGDERCVGPEHPDSNYRMVAESLLPHAPGALVHRIEGELGGEPAARAYDALIRSHLTDEPPALDVALLGIGPDCHVASLFAGNPALELRGVACVPVHDAPKPPPERVSLSLEVLQAARRCVLLASGADKAQAVSGALGPRDPRLPASLLRRERLLVIADVSASASDVLR